MGTDQLDLSLMPVEWAETDLVRWLDKELRQPDVSQEKLEEWIRAPSASCLVPGASISPRWCGQSICSAANSWAQSQNP